MRPDLSHLRVFGCDAYALTPKALRNKLQENSRKCTLIGYGNTAVHYRLWDSDKREVFTATNVIFNEQEFTAIKALGQDNDNEALLEEEVQQYHDENAQEVVVARSGADSGITPDESVQPRAPQPAVEDEQAEIDRQLETEA